MMRIPAVDMLDHQVVQLVGGVPGTEVLRLPDPVAVALQWIEHGAPMLHVVDLDAALGRGNNDDHILDIINAADVPVQVGGGIRDRDRLDMLVDAGAARVVVGTKAIRDPTWLEDMAWEYPGILVLAMDTKGGMVQVKGWQEDSGASVDEIFDRTRDLPLNAVLNTNVDVEGQARGIDVAAATDFVRRCPHAVIASGGITTMADIDLLEQAGCEGAVIGVALYTGKLNSRMLWGD